MSHGSWPALWRADTAAVWASGCSGSLKSGVCPGEEQPQKVLADGSAHDQGKS